MASVSNGSTSSCACQTSCWHYRVEVPRGRTFILQPSSALLPASSTEGDRGFLDRARQDPSSRPFWRVHRVSRQLLVACARGGARWTRGARRRVQDQVPRAGARLRAAGSVGPRTFPRVGTKGSGERVAAGRSRPAGLGEAEITRLLSLWPGAAQRWPRFPPEAQVRLGAPPGWPRL